MEGRGGYYMCVVGGGVDPDMSRCGGRNMCARELFISFSSLQKNKTKLYKLFGQFNRKSIDNA